MEVEVKFERGLSAWDRKHAHVKLQGPREFVEDALKAIRDKIEEKNSNSVESFHWNEMDHV